MAASIRFPAAGSPAGGPARKAALALASAAAFLLAACLQTEPGAPGPDNTTVTPPEDNGRKAGASSSTNWPPTELGSKRIRLQGDADSAIRIFFHMIQLAPPFEILPAEVPGSLRLFRSGAIPALETPVPKEWAFGPTDTVVIPATFLDSLWKSEADTLTFNIQVHSDNQYFWLMGFSYSKREGRLVASPFSNSSGETNFLVYQDYYIRGNLKVDTVNIPPASGKSELCFYIPGTPIFGKADTASSNQIGPLPKGEFPLRLLRLSHPATQTRETLVEAWEVAVKIVDRDTLLTPGAKVLSVRTQGELNLRNAE